MNAFSTQRQNSLQGRPGVGHSRCVNKGLKGVKGLWRFTLLELMAAVVIISALTVLFVPSFARLMQSNRISSNVNAFMADLRYARSESTRRGGGVVMCRSDKPDAAVPLCSTTSGANGRGWASGWVIYVDAKRDGMISAGDVLRVQSPVARLAFITEKSGDAPRIFRFTGTGRLLDVSSATSLQFGGSADAPQAQRVLCVNPGGHARIAGDGTASCDTDSS